MRLEVGIGFARFWGKGVTFGFWVRCFVFYVWMYEYGEGDGGFVLLVVAVRNRHHVSAGNMAAPVAANN